MSGYLYKEFINYLYNNPLIIAIYSLIISFIVLFINKVKPILYTLVFLIILSLYFCLYTNNLLYFILGIEVYNILYLLLIYNASQNYYLLIALRKLSLLSMIISSIILFGTTLICLENNILYFNNINISDQLSKLGLFFILIGILFKLCVFPFHIWILDIYKNSPYYILLITDCFLKLILLQILLKFISVFQINNFYNIFLILGTTSMFLGIILSIKESNIKRFIGLFNISHLGLIVLMLSINNTNVYKSVLGYLLMYSTCSLCFLLSIKDNIQNFRDLINNNTLINKNEHNKNLQNIYINKTDIGILSKITINHEKSNTSYNNVNNNITKQKSTNNNINVYTRKIVNNNIYINEYINNTILIDNIISKNNLVIIILSLFAMMCIPPFHTFFAKVDLILVILENNEYIVLILSTMYFILEIIIIIVKSRFLKSHTSTEIK